MKVDTSSIVKNRKISYIEKKYGVGETMTKAMTFEILKCLIVLFGIIAIGAIGGLITFAIKEMDTSIITRLSEVLIGFLSPIIMAFAGYFIGRKVE